MASAKGKVVVSAEVPESLRDEVDARAGAEGRSRAEIIGRAVRFYLRYAAVVPEDEPPPPDPNQPRPPRKKKAP